MRDLLIDACTRILQEHEFRAQAQPESGTMSWELWAALEQTGFTDLLGIPSGDDTPSLGDVIAVIARVAESTAPVPLAETLLAQYILRSAAKRAIGPRTLLNVGSSEGLSLQSVGGVWRIRGRARRVPWARHCASLVVVVPTAAGALAATVPIGGSQITLGANLAGESRDDLVFDDAIAADVGAPRFALQEIRALGSLMRSAQMTGAIARILRMTIDHAAARRQFGRPLTQFQAVKHAIARIGQNHAAAVAAVDHAAREAQIDAGSLALPLAKIRVGEAAGASAAISHQVFGAVGYTREHELQAHTRRIWSWRDEFGSEAYWSDKVGRQVCAGGAEGLWAAVLGQTP
ncbi:MAG TPA: acyl-CoA dehydrogenase family protein [Bradyrhizobium sp.]